MTDLFQIVVECNRWQRTAHGTVCLMFGSGHAFPDPKWDDFAPVLLGWWLRDALAMATGSVTTSEWSFMDGPFAVRVHAGDGGIWSLSPIERTRFAPASAAYFVPRATAIAALLNAATSVDRSYRTHGWQHDSDYLEMLSNAANLRERGLEA